MTTFFAFIIVLGILIFFHELGHFLLAKANKVGVLKFSLGFGPAIIKKRIGETEYRLSAIPLGGYVKMLGEDPSKEEELTHIEESRSFSHKGLKAKAAIVFAGPAFNILLAVMIFTIIAWTGIPYLLPVAGMIERDSPAYRAGLMTGDRIVSIGETPVESWNEVAVNIQKSTPGKEIEIQIERDKNLFSIHLIPEMMATTNEFGEEIQRPGINISPYMSPVTGKVSKDSPAHKAGMLPGDRIVSIGETRIESWMDISDAIQQCKVDTPIHIEIERDNSIQTLEVAPTTMKSKNQDGEEIDRLVIGIQPEDNFAYKRYGLFKGLGYGISKSYWIIKLTGIAVKKMVIGELDMKKSLGGPILIAQVSGQTFRAGMLPFFSMIAFVSVNLALINLLPIPILDGGFLLLFLIEGITGKPVEGRPREIAQQIGLFLLILLMLFAFYNDIARIITGE